MTEKPTMSGMRAACVVLSVMAVMVLAGCTDARGPSAAGLNALYEASLEATAADAVVLANDPELESAALERLQTYFARVTPDHARATTASVYAPDAWLYDNLAVVRGLADIEAYFVKASGEADDFTVEFLQFAPAGIDYYVRWRMAITSKALAGGEPIVSYGVTQFRFDRNGRVLLHRDFWDAATGLYESLPVIGSLVTRVRLFLGSMPSNEPDSQAR